MLLLYQSLYDLTNPSGYNLISVIVLINALGHTLMPVLDRTNSLGLNLISVLGHTIQSQHLFLQLSHLKCQAILLILPCLATPYLTTLGCFCLASYIPIHIIIAIRCCSPESSYASQIIIYDCLVIKIK